jgi:ABC-type antimicrobial peptide transport system permease subunit
MFYVPLAQNVDYKNALMKRLELTSHFIGGIMLVTRLSPGVLEPLLTKTLAEVDPNLTITGVRTMEQQVALSFDQARSVSSLAGLFGIVALLLAALGLYGVTAYAVARRTQEIGIRMALGASTGDVRKMVVWQGMALALAGVVIGVAAAFGLTRWMASLLYGVTPKDPIAMASVTVLLIGVALAATYFPARRASRVDPVVSLRYE